jgi:copper chaperone CopZ
VVYSGALSDLKAQTANAVPVKTVSIPVEGMSCVACAARVKRTLKGIEGVQHVEVSLELRDAMVRFLPKKVTPERLEAAINALGYKAGKSRVVESK